MVIKGNTHKTYIKKKEVIQYLNNQLKVPTKEEINELVDLLRNNGIVAAKIKYQDKKVRVFERLDGEFYRKFTFSQCLKAIKFLKKLHKIIKKTKQIGHFHIVKDFADGNDMIWGDVNASNFLWKNGEIIGIVDYDNVSKGNLWLDVSMAIVNWQKDFNYKKSLRLIKEYGIKGDWVEWIQKYILLTHKQYSDVSFGLNHIKKSRNYCFKRIKKLNEQYEKSISWR